tara:strand:+ start:701 stop:832 length:132 start_codon:yes stop_codon:yes gene_type:complete
MNGEDVEDWSEKHFGSLALVRTVVGFINLIVACIIMGELFGWL